MTWRKFRRVTFEITWYAKAISIGALFLCLTWQVEHTPDWCPSDRDPRTCIYLNMHTPDWMKGRTP